MLRHGFDVGVDARVRSIDHARAPVIILYKPADSYAGRGIRRRTAGVAIGGRWCNCVVVDEVLRVGTVVPVLSAERATRQGVLHDVEELPVARKDFEFAIVEKIVSAAESGTDFFREIETD